MSRMSNSRGRILVVSAAVGFGLMPIFARYAYAAGLSVPTLLLLRFTLAAGLLFGYLAATGRFALPSRRELGVLFLLGGVLYAAQSLLYFTSVRFISPALTALLLYLYPAVVLALTAALTRTRPSASRVAAIIVSLIGLGFVLGSPTAISSWFGVACGIGAALVYSVYIVIGERIGATVSPMEATAFVALFAAITFAGTGWATGSLRFDFDPTGWWPILAVAVVSTVIAIGAFFAGMNIIGPVRASILSMVEPVVSVVAATLLLDESMTPVQFLGGAIVLGAAVWGIANPTRRRG